MADGPIRTVRGMGGPRSLKAVSLKVSPLPEGKGYECLGLEGAIRGVGRTPELALEAAQEAQQAYMANDVMQGRGPRTVTPEEIGYKP